jgi:hypothetical protein
MSIENFLRIPVKMEQLIQLTENGLDMYVLYTTPDVGNINEDTVFYLDNHIEVDDDDNEIYPPFAKQNGLLFYFNGDTATDIIFNTKYQLGEKTPNIDDYIRNFNYYNEHDCFIDFE